MIHLAVSSVFLSGGMTLVFSGARGYAVTWLRTTGAAWSAGLISCFSRKAVC